MDEQYVMNTAGELEPEQPRTWDGEPLYSTATVQEGLFPAEAFEQMRGQMPLDALDQLAGMSAEQMTAIVADLIV